MIQVTLRNVKQKVMPHERAPHVPPQETEELPRSDESLEAPERDISEGPEKEVTLYEEQIVEKLDNPDLNNLQNFRDTIIYAVKGTVHGLEKAIHAKQDIKDFVRGGYLRGRYNRAKRKQARLEKKAGLQGPEGASMFAFRRKKFARKARVHKMFLERKGKYHDAYARDMEARRGARAEEKEVRDKAYEAKREELLQKSWEAQFRKAKRRERTLERLKKFPLKPEQLEDIERRQAILVPALREITEEEYEPAA
jgi:hypothetical protein